MRLSDIEPSQIRNALEGLVIMFTALFAVALSIASGSWRCGENTELNDTEHGRNPL